MRLERSASTSLSLSMSGPLGGGTGIGAQQPSSTHFGKFSFSTGVFSSSPEVFFAIFPLRCPFHKPTGPKFVGIHKGTWRRSPAYRVCGQDQRINTQLPFGCHATKRFVSAEAS